MQRLMNTFLKMIICTMFSMLGSAIAAGIVVLRERTSDALYIPSVWLFGYYPLPPIVTVFLDVMPGALLFGLFLLPSIIIYFILDFFDRTRKARFIGYITPNLALLLLLSIGYYQTFNSVDGEGAQMAVFMMECIVASSIVVFFFLSLLNRVKNRHPASLNTASH